MASGGQLPALADCTHDFFWDQTHKDHSDMYMQEVRNGNLDWSKKQPYEMWCGPCHRCSSDGASDWTMCNNCKAVWCFDCANTYVQEEIDRKRALAAYHSYCNGHQFTMDSSCHCDQCMEKEVVAHAGVNKCDCGIALCAGCRHIHDWTTSEAEEVNCMYCQRPATQACACGHATCLSCLMVTTGQRFVQCFEGPHTFFVSDVAKAADNDTVKLEWLNMELGPGHDLVAFAEKCLFLFSGVITSTVKQKFTCLKLYRKYSGVDEVTGKGDYDSIELCREKLYTMECQIPPYELQPFQQLWNARAPRRCAECNCELPEDCDGPRCKKHRAVPTQLQHTCKKRLDENGREVCGGLMSMVRGFGCCEKCGSGKELQESVAGSPECPDWVFAFRREAHQASHIVKRTIEDDDRTHQWAKKRRL